MGRATPEEAADRYVQYLRDLATGLQIVPEERDSFTAAVRPMATLTVPTRVEISPDLVYFDKAAPSGHRLDARLIAERLSQRWFITGGVVCESAIVSDPYALENLFTTD